VDHAGAGKSAQPWHPTPNGRFGRSPVDRFEPDDRIGPAIACLLMTMDLEFPTEPFGR
jgi:hypothetical protein